jgi:hypothetical protein
MKGNIKSQQLINIEAVNMKYCTVRALCNNQWGMYTVEMDAVVSEH